MTLVPISGGSLFTRVDGSDPSLPWLVLSNGIATDHIVWDPQISVLTKSHRILRYDTRGHGASEAPAGPYSFTMLADDVVAILDHYSIGQARFLGLSLGGMTGLGLALRHPERVTSLVCCNARADAPPPFAKSWDDRLAAISAGGMEAIVQGTLDRWLSASGRQLDPGAETALGAMIRRTSPDGFAGCAAALKQLDFLKELPTMTRPVLYVAGAADMGAPQAVMQQMAEATPGATFAVVPDAAHISNRDNPTGFVAAITPFLGLKPGQEAAH